jgi:hypothetical protein
MINWPAAAAFGLTHRARLAVRAVERGMTAPSLAALDFVGDLYSFQIAYAFADLNVADALAGGAKSAAALAIELEVDGDALYRLLRAATNLDLVREEPGRAFRLCPVGRALSNREEESLRDYIVFMGRVGYRFWGRLTDSVRQGRTAIEIETGKRPFDYLLDDPEVRRLFARAMTAVSNLSAHAFVAVYDVGRFRTIVDVGGGHGRLLSTILAAVPVARGVLFDLPDVVTGARDWLAGRPERDRIDIVGGSFFEQIPKGGDLYVLKSILHDWQDADALRILRAVRRSMPPGSTLTLVESIVPEENSKHFAKVVDVEMLVHGGGRERTRDEHRALLVRAGFRLSRFIGTAAPISIVEAEPA